MPWLRLRIELVTPCFLAGSAGGKSSVKDLQEEGLRPASLIGVWRFWHRALRAAEQRQAELFGSQRRIDGCGPRQGRIAVRSGPAPAADVAAPGSSLDDLTGNANYLRHQDPPAPAIDPLQYLLGMGLCNLHRQIQRPALKAGGTFAVEVNVRRGPGATDAWRELRQTLWLWQTFGGLGARSRRGWGAVEVTPVPGWEAIEDAAEREEWERWFTRPAEAAAVRQRLASLCPQMNTETPRLGFTAAELDPRQPAAAASSHEAAFSNLSACCLVTGARSHPTWAEALAELGLTFLRIRSTANRGNRPAGEFRVQDHDAVAALLQHHTRPAHAPYRAAFGLPHNYYFQHLHGRRKAEFEGSRRGEARRASPLLVQVVRLAAPSGVAHLPLALWLKAPLTSDGSVSEKKTGTANLPAPDWRAVVRYLTELLAATAAGAGGGNTPAGGGAEPARVAQQIPTAVQTKPLRQGETRVGTLRLNAVVWAVWFDDAGLQGNITNRAQVPTGTADGTRAEFAVEKVEMAKRLAFVRFLRTVPHES